MKYVTIVISIFISFNSYAQRFLGQVIDNSNNEPISFVNIGIVGKNIGTVSNKDGKFQLELNDKFNSDTLRISCIGYESLNFMIWDFKKKALTDGLQHIKLIPKVFQLSEVIVTPKKIKTIKLGNSNSNSGSRFLTDSSGLGSEIGLIIRLPRKEKDYYIKKLNFNVADKNFDTIHARVNIYNLKNGLPNNNILERPIYIEITTDGLISIDLRKYNIRMKEDFFISIENFNEKSWKNKLKFWAVFKTFSKKGTDDCLYRPISQGNWIHTPVVEVRFSVEAEYEK
jgi:hypothetical protein